MSEAQQAVLDKPPETQLQKVQADLAKLERREWWLWAMAMIVMLLLTAAVGSLSFPELFRFDDPFFQFSLNQAVRGLAGLVLLFNTYTFYQHVTMKKLRRQLSQQLAAMGQLQERAQEFHKQATVDALTGLYNRRFAEERLRAEVGRSRRHGHPLTVVAIDLNDFKPVNDKYGHAAGDQVLKEFAERLLKATRASDMTVRMGGDEFLVILPECPVGQVQTMLARLSPMHVNYQGQKIAVTFSAGWVGYEPGETPEQFVERADQTLYADKRNKKKQRAETPFTVR